jgi:hypothetical protein
VHLHGKSVVELLDEIACFPSLCSMRKWIKSYCVKVHGFDYKKLRMDGSDGWLRLVRDKFFREVAPTARRAVTLATDGMYVTARFEASVDPQREGVAWSTDLSAGHLTPDEIASMVRNPALLRKRSRSGN